MWPRIIEAVLGCWMLAAPFIFRQTPKLADYTISALISGGILLTTALVSIWPPARNGRFGTLLVALWLLGHGYFSAARPGPPAAQNEIVVGLTLLLFAILPNDINRIPEPWSNRPDPAGVPTRSTRGDR